MVRGPGTVYVVFRETDPHLVKVGYTTKSAEQRARELRTTGVADHFVVAYDVFVNDARAVEKEVHAALADSRYVDDREFFTCGPKPAIDALLRAAEGRRMASPWSDAEVELLPQLAERYSTVLEPKLTSAALTVRDDGVVLRCSFKSWDGEISMAETNLGFIWGDNEPMFSPEASLRVNAELFLRLTALDLAHCTPLMREGVHQASLEALD